MVKINYVMRTYSRVPGRRRRRGGRRRVRRSFGFSRRRRRKRRRSVYLVSRGGTRL